MKVESCKQCVYAGQVYDDGSILWVCAQTPEMPNRMVRVCHHEVCSRFRRRAEVTRCDEAIKQPADKDIRYIPLTQGQVAIVDASDYAWLSLYRWHVQKPGGKHYAARRQHNKLITMHREIMQPLDGYVVDHIDGDGLNNRRSNLRICTRQQNYCNRAKAPGCSSAYKGVNLHKKTGKYLVSIRFQGQRMYLGCFDDEIEAARAYDRKAFEVFGEFAWLNFPADYGRPPHRRPFSDSK
jgi:hypothetical protein